MRKRIEAREESERERERERESLRVMNGKVNGGGGAPKSRLG